MIPKPKESITRSRQIEVFAFFAVLSVAVHAGIVIWLLNWALSPTSAGKTYRAYFLGSVHKGELWYPEVDIHYLPQKVTEYRIARLNLTTGVHTPGLHASHAELTSLVTLHDGGAATWIDDVLYVICRTAIFRMHGKTLEKLADLPPQPKSLWAGPFFYNGQFTTVVEVADDGSGYHEMVYQLAHLIDGQWINGPKILLPGPGRTWVEDAATGDTILSPLDPSTTSELTTRNLGVIVEQDGDDVHILVICMTDSFDPPAFFGYRNGFEFIDDSSELASASQPANLIKDVTGWEAIKGTTGGAVWTGIAVDRDGALFTQTGNLDPPFEYVRRDKNGNWRRLSTVSTPFYDRRWNSFVMDLAEHRAWAVNFDQIWNSAVFSPVKENAVGEPQLVVLKNVNPMTIRLTRHLLAGFLLAWMLHIAIVIAGTPRLISDSSPIRYQFGNRHMFLASFRQRAIAFMIDVLLIVSIVIGWAFFQSQILGITWQPNSSFEIYEPFDRLLFELQRGPSGTANMFLNRFEEFLSPTVTALRGQTDPALWESCLLVGIGLWVIKISFERRFGMTPGKWFVGIHTLRSTLRPCGFGQILTRNVLYWIDLLCFLTPLPAAISMTLSRNCQRLGDFVADTIVVRSQGAVIGAHEESDRPVEI